MVWYLVCLMAAAGIILQGFFIFSEYKKKYVLADVLKGLASLMFVIIGFIGYKSVSNETTSGQLGKMIAIGLVLGLIGDVLLNLRFVLKKHGQKAFLVGILFFLIGHIMYLCALIPISEHMWICIGIGAVLAAGLLAYIFKTMEVKIAFKIFGIFYLSAVIIMTVIAIGIALSTGGVHDIVYAVGAVLFTASDIVLIFNTFSGKTKFALRITNLTLYYFGQLLIAGSLYILR